MIESQCFASTDGGLTPKEAIVWRMALDSSLQLTVCIHHLIHVESHFSHGAL